MPDATEYVELRLSDIGSDEDYPSFWVMETLYQWDAANSRAMKGTPQIYPFETLDEAQKFYDERRRMLTEKGFRYSDIDW